jgi:hypothetical protein
MNNTYTILLRSNQTDSVIVCWGTAADDVAVLGCHSVQKELKLSACSRYAAEVFPGTLLRCDLIARGVVGHFV